MPMTASRYYDGNDVRIGDQILYAGQLGTIVCVIDTGSYSSAYPESWSYLQEGFMMDVAGMGLVHMNEADEDLELVARAPL